MTRANPVETAIQAMVSLFYLFCCAVLIHGPVKAGEDELSPGESRGKRIYIQGLGGDDRAIQAFYGADRVQVPASVLPCVNCHGHDGLGRPEGGLTPSNITWDALTKPYGGRHPGGRAYPPYTERDLIRAISMGVDPGGNRLSTTMPRFQLTHSEMDDLIAYLRRLGHYHEPGLTDSGIKIGVVLPPPDRLPGMRDVLKTALDAGIQEINTRGGVFGRKLEMRFVSASSQPDQRRLTYRQFLDHDEPFLLLAGFMAGDEKDIAALLQQRRVPMIGAFTLDPPEDVSLNRWVFYLQSGFKDQVRALARFATREFDGRKPSAALIFQDTAPYREAVAAVRLECRRLGWPTLKEFDRDGVTGEVAAGLAAQNIQAVFFLGDGTKMIELIQLAEKRHWRPLFLGTGSQMSQGFFDLPASVRVCLALPGRPRDLTSEGWSYIESIGLDPRSSLGRRVSRLTGLASLKLLEEGLRRSGRDVTREKIIASLENLYRFSTGLTADLTYGPNRRIGARGAYIVRLDLQNKTWRETGDWIDVD